MPYRPEHVPKYHDWMSINEIQELTSSEPLSLEEEYQMQMNWLNDEDKLTFIVLSRDLYESAHEKNETDREIYSMVGDVNLFLSEDTEENHSQLEHLAELNVMIVDHANRNKGFGSESISLMMNYAKQNFKSIVKFIAKIDETNMPSIRMFQNKFRFALISHSQVFKQVLLELKINSTNSNGSSEKIS